MAKSEGSRKPETRLNESIGLAPEALHSIIASTPAVAIEIFDIEGRVLSWNRAAELIFGYTEAEALGKTLDELILDDETHQRYLSLLRKIAETGQWIGPLEWRVIRKDGSEGYVYSSTFALPNQRGGKFFACMDVDMTLSKQIEKRLEQRVLTETLTRDEAQHAVCLRDHLILAASHELLAPLTPLRMQIDLIKAMITQNFLDELPRAREILQLLERSRSNVTHMLATIEGMSDVSRMSMSTSELELQPVNVSQLLSRVAERFSGEIQSSGSTIHFNLDASLVAQLDPSRMERVMIYLISDAIKYGDGKPIEFGVRRRGQKVEIWVKDQGVRTAEPMGLHFVRMMVELHAGRVQTSSPSVMGFELMIELPLLAQGRAESA